MIKVILTSLQVHTEAVDHSVCSPVCKTSLRLVEDSGGYNITLRASCDETTPGAKMFHFSESL